MEIKTLEMKEKHECKCVKVFPTGYALFVCPETGCNYVRLVGWASMGNETIVLDPGSDPMIGHFGTTDPDLQFTRVELTQKEDSGLAEQWFKEAGFKFTDDGEEQCGIG